MKNMILLEVGSGSAQKVEAQAFSKTTANIYITADTPQAATCTTGGWNLQRTLSAKWWKR